MTLAIVALVVLSTVALLSAMSLRANRRFRTQRLLPMQWLLDGSVIRTAPRPFVLAFTPVLAAACLAGVLALTIFLEPRPGQDHLVIPVTLCTALGFLAVHAFHLQLMQRILRRQV